MYLFPEFWEVKRMSFLHLALRWEALGEPTLTGQRVGTTRKVEAVSSESCPQSERLVDLEVPDFA